MKHKIYPFKAITEWFASVTKYSREEYQLNKYLVPEYLQIKQAHQLLLKEYVRALASVSRLSFFVGYHEIKLPKEGLVKGQISFLVQKYFPSRLLTWRPLVKLLVESHIHKKLTQLSVIYTQTAFLVQGSLVENSEYLVWLKQAKQECDEFRQTLSSGGNLIDILNKVGGSAIVLFLAVMGVNNNVELIRLLLSGNLSAEQIAQIILGLLFIGLIVFYFYLFSDSAFSAKRLIFTGTGSDISEKHNIYVFENEVFKILGRGKPKEFPIDYFGQSIFQISAVGFLFWMQGLLNRVTATVPNSINLPCFSCIGIIIAILFVGDVVSPLLKRYAQGYI